MGIMTQIADVDHAISALDAWLREQDYTRRSRDGIAAHIREHGELSGAVPSTWTVKTSSRATEIFVESLPPVPPESDDWGDEGQWTPSDAYRIEPPELDDEFDVPDAPDYSVTLEPGYREALEADGILILPISGGADPTPFAPSEQDWQDYREYSEWLDRLDAFNADRLDRPTMEGIEAGPGHLDPCRLSHAHGSAIAATETVQGQDDKAPHLRRGIGHVASHCESEGRPQGPQRPGCRLNAYFCESCSAPTWDTSPRPDRARSLLD